MSGANKCAVEGCKNKIRITDYKCKCGNLYCASHIFFTSHDCTFDYKQKTKDTLQQTMPQIIASKVEKL